MLQEASAKLQQELTNVHERNVLFSQSNQVNLKWQSRKIHSTTSYRENTGFYDYKGGCEKIVFNQFKKMFS